MEHHWRQSLCSGTWDERCCPPITIRRRWNRTWRGRRENGEICKRSWEGRERIVKRMGGGGVMRFRCKQCSCLYPRRGFWPPGWRNPSRGFTTRQRGGWQIWAPNVSDVGCGCTHPLGRRWKWWYWRRSGYISPAARTGSQNILRIILSWNCVWRRSGSRECAYPGDGGSSPSWKSWG